MCIQRYEQIAWTNAITVDLTGPASAASRLRNPSREKPPAGPRGKKNPPPGGTEQKKEPAAPYFPPVRSIIGAGELDFRVRNGNGYCLPAMAAGT